VVPQANPKKTAIFPWALKMRQADIHHLGSPTTGEACIELGRRYLGIELGPEFVELSRQRLASVKRQQPQTDSIDRTAGRVVLARS
jgi:DNA modification methylase